MSNNLLELLKQYFSGDVVSNIAALIGETPTNTESALQKALPSLLAGMVEKSTDANSLNNIFSLLSQGSHDGGILSNLGALSTGGDETTKLIAEGGNLLTSLFGVKSGELSDLIANNSVISKNATNSLLGFITPVALGLIGKTLKIGNTNNATGLADLLSEQSVYLKDLIPSNLSSSLTDNLNKTPTNTDTIVPYTIEVGDKPDDEPTSTPSTESINEKPNNIGKEIEEVAEQTLASAKHIVEELSESAGQFGSSMVQESKQFADNAADAIEEGAGEGGKFLPWLLILAALFLMWGLLKSCSAPETEATAPKMAEQLPSAPQPTPATPLPPTQPILPEAPEPPKTDSSANELTQQSNFFEKTLSTGYSIKTAKDGFESKLVGFIEGNEAINKDLWFTTDGIQFDSGKATIRPESAAQINDIAEILKAYPNVKIKIGGYTDNTGKAQTNKKLSNDRAIAVQKAIVSQDIKADRIDAEGFGSEHPLGSNDTPEGRQQNRRIDVKVVEK